MSEIRFDIRIHDFSHHKYQVCEMGNLTLKGIRLMSILGIRLAM